MICRNCLRAASKARIPASSIRQPLRFLTTTSPLRSASPISATQPTSPTPTPTPSTPAQPLSEPLTPAPSPNLKAQAAKAAEKKATPLVKSSIPAGQPLKGLNFLKNAQDPVALPDDEYPAWLWTILDRQEKKAETGAGDLFSKSKKQRRLAAKRLRKEQAMNPGMLMPKVPIYEQTIDLPAGDGSVAGAVQAADARDELTKAMRNKRRATIKEANFLKAMG
ncbi:mitochondrial ribosomal protein L37-domain-containing protein [Pyrenochaeta sp. MPI-SDFR-AT-0127]|nr:mitochondrial ribosomal protein L37-domain-containing protein [Pyrenochaeta sp. MPI-SDFR-AT-0127]